MIRRDLPGRRQGVEGVLCVPYDRSGPLPALVGAPPSSPEEALALAVDYAAAHPGQGQERAVVRFAWRALMKAFPAVARADVEARVSGVDVLGDYLVRLAGGPAPEPTGAAYALPPAPARREVRPPF